MFRGQEWKKIFRRQEQKIFVLTFHNSMWTGKENCLYQHGRLKYDNEETTLLLRNLMSKKKCKKKNVGEESLP